MSTLWLDRLLAVPLIGIRWDPPYDFSEDEYLQKMRPLLASFPADEKWTREIKGPSSYRVECGNFTLATTIRDATVDYKYRARLTAGPIPEVKLGSIKPFTELLKDTVGRTKAFVRALPFMEQSNVLRIGIVASLKADANAPPPGLSDFLSFLGRPWGTMPSEGHISYRVNLSENDEAIDRCSHQVAIPAKNEPIDPSSSEETSVIDLHIDWQRYFKNPIRRSPDDLDALLNDAVAAANRYYDKFGKGDLNYGNQPK